MDPFQAASDVVAVAAAVAVVEAAAARSSLLEASARWEEAATELGCCPEEPKKPAGRMTKRLPEQAPLAV